MDNFREEIKNNLSKVTHKGRVLFATTVCERLYPNYVAFQNGSGWGDAQVLQEGIAMIRQYLIKEDLFEESEVKDMAERIDRVTPHTEEFPGIVTSFALDACNSVYCTLNYMLDHSVDNIADVASFARDTVDMYIQELEDIKANDPEIEEKIGRNRFMLSEKKAQQELLKKLIAMEIASVTDRMVDELTDKSLGIDLRLLPR